MVRGLWNMGTLEDVVDIVLNIKQLALRLHAEVPKRHCQGNREYFVGAPLWAAGSLDFAQFFSQLERRKAPKTPST